MALFWKSLKNHPGLPIAAFLSVAGAIAGAGRDGNPLLGALFGFGIMGAFTWVPVLITAWTGRKQYAEEE